MAVLCAVIAGTIPGVPAATAEEAIVVRAVKDVCLPYASRSRSFENAIRAARAAGFRRPSGDNAPLEEFASEVDLVSADGVWRLRLEEGSREDEDQGAYAVGCTLTSRRAGARRLVRLARSAFGNAERWTRTDSRRWDRRTPRPDVHRMVVAIRERSDAPALTITGLYY